ncbi:MAG: hypothetical protein NTX76_03075 [Alphaproteobacteria bacterium]|nr:hypothetical protein [Alphaproteobacteria bacterium]
MKISAIKLGKFITTWGQPTTGGASVFLLAFSALAFLFSVLSDTNYTDLCTNMNQLENDLVEKKHTYEILKHYTEGIHQYPDQFNSFQKKHFSQPVSFDHLKEQFQSWQKHCKIQMLTTQSGNEEVESKDLGLSKRSVSVTVKVLHDTQIYQFMEKIQTELPGLSQIKKFHIRRVSALTDDLLTKISAGKMATLLEGTIEFDWIYRTAPNSKQD